jgi:DNA-binding NarL/FixJ family response regulator
MSKKICTGERKMKLQVLLADDHALFRDGMRYVLQQLSEQVDVICAGDFAETLRQAGTNPDIDLALIDLNMPGSDGVSSIRIFHQSFPGIPLVVVSGSDQRAEMEWVMEYGAMGFISKMSSAKEMVNALRVVLGGDIYFPPQLLAQAKVAPMPHGIEDRNSLHPGNHGLTRRQMEALQYLAEGLSNKEIAMKMKLAEGTIKVHVAGAYQVLQVSSRLDAVRKAQKLGLIPLVPEGRNDV